MITFFVCLPVSDFSFFFVKFFSFKMTKKQNKIKTEYYLKLVQLFFGHNFFFLKVTLCVTLSKRSKLPVSKYFLMYVVVQFYPWFKVYFP